MAKQKLTKPEIEVLARIAKCAVEGDCDIKLTNKDVVLAEQAVSKLIKSQ